MTLLLDVTDVVIAYVCCVYSRCTSTTGHAIDFSTVQELVILWITVIAVPSLITHTTLHSSHIPSFTHHTYNPTLSHIPPFTHHTYHPSLIIPPFTNHIPPFTHHTYHPHTSNLPISLTRHSIPISHIVTYFAQPPCTIPLILPRILDSNNITLLPRGVFRGLKHLETV